MAPRLLGEWHRRARRVRRCFTAIALVLFVVPGSAGTPTPDRPAPRADGAAVARSLSLPTATHRPAFVAARSTDDRVIAPPPARFDAPPAPPAPPPEQLAAAAGRRAGGTWAVIVGINDYPGGGSDLRASVNDANDVDAALAAYGIPAERRLVLRDTQATAAVIDAALGWLVDHAAADATAIFFYAGHIRKQSGGTEAIVAADGRLLTDETVARRLRPLAARRAWIALAACYAGGFTEVLAPGRILTGAAGPDSLAYENASYGRSYLVEFMVRRAMLEGRAAGSVEQSFAWAEEALRREHPDRVPVQHDAADGELALGVAPPPPVPAPAEETPPGAPPPSGPTPPDDAPDGEDDDCVLTVGSLLGCHD